MIALPPLASEHIFNLGFLNVTNTYINSTLTVVFFLVLGFLLKRNIKTIPSGLQNFFEFLVEAMLGYADQVTGSRKKSLSVLPIFGSLFLFILVSNWLGVIPGVGSVVVHKTVNGIQESIPVFRPANTDLNLTLAMAVLGVTLSHILGVAAIGFWRYANKFIKVGDLYRAIKSKKPMNVLTAVIEFGVGFIEIISEVAKLISLSLRLFGNVFAGEVLLTVLASIIAYLVPLPFIGLELLVGIVQATVFAMLILVYITIATAPLPVHGHESEHAKTSGVPDLIPEHT